MMKTLFVSLKGGVGKSSIALNYAIYTNTKCVTNDIIAPDNDGMIKVPPSKKRLPLNCTKKNTVYDFGAMSTNIDPKVAHAIKLCDAVVIPTLTDPRSLQATVDTYNLVKESGKPVAIIINNFIKQRKHDAAKQFLLSTLGRVPIFAMRSTTLFERVAKDGEQWFSHVHQNNGEYQLNKTRKAHEMIYDAITRLGVAQ